MNVRSTIIGAILLNMACTVLAHADNHNYVKAVEMLTSDGSNGIETVQYYDGLGRAVYNVTEGANGQYLHSLNMLDALDRVTQSWNPIVHSSLNLMDTDSLQYASFTLYLDPLAFSSFQYDGLGRMTTARRPGLPWEDRTQLTHYITNQGSTIKKYVVSGGRPQQNGFYATGELSGVVCLNEEGHQVATYQNLFGNVVMESIGEDNCTYYVYDELNRLCFVLQPMYQNCPDEGRYAFRYTYDQRGRILTKTLPGCSPIHYWYDDADRVIMMQDSILASAQKYRVYTYDELGRLKTQRITNEINDELELVNFYDSYEFINQYPALNLECTDGAVLGSSYCNSYTQYETYGHTRLTGTWQKASNGEPILTTYIYDEFGRIAKLAEIGLGKNAIVTEYTYNFVGDVTSEVTNYYSYNVEDNTLEESITTFIENNYDSPHTKLLTSSVIYMRDISNNLTMTDTIQHLSYDDFGRVIRNDRGGSHADMSYEYDLLHGWTTDIRSDGGFEQTLFRENSDTNPRWDGSISAMAWKNSASDQTKRYDYTYDGLKRLTEAVYSEPSASGANMGARERGFEGDDEDMERYIPNPSPRIAGNKFGESYTYDMNSNMTSLCRYGMLNDLSYGLIDDLAIGYDGNQRMSVQDAVSVRLNYSGASDFVNGADSIIEYTYDGNGNLLRDRNKGLNFSYDLLGHPLRVWSDDGMNVIEYVYAPDRRKLRTRHSRNRIATVKDFRGALEVVNGDVDRINFQGGFYSYDYVDNHYSRNYYIQDYQGNIRKTERMDDWGSYVSEYTVSVTDYYPYGNPHKSSSDYKYSGKYLDRSYGLDLYDFEARQYDAVVPGFSSQDQLAEKYYDISPYAYCAGDPVNRVDYDGMSYTVDTLGYISYINDGITSISGMGPNGKKEMNLDKQQINVINQIIDEQSETEHNSIFSRKSISRASIVQLYHFLASCMATEIALTEMNAKGGNNFHVTLSHFLGDGYLVGSVNLPFESLENVNYSIHSHGTLGATEGPSGENLYRTSGDYNTALNLFKASGYIQDGTLTVPDSQAFKLMIYHRYSDSLFRYNPWYSKHVKSGFKIFNH